MFFKKYTSWPFNLIIIFVACGLFLAGQSIMATWDSPDCDPTADPTCNIPKPINVGPDAQDKLGGLLLRSGLMLHDSPLLFKSSNNVNDITIKAEDGFTNSYTWTLPPDIPSDADPETAPYFLTTDYLGSLSWESLLDINTQDEDWGYEGTGPNYTSIWSDFLTRIGSDQTNRYATEVNGNGDLYVQDDLEVDGNTYANLITANKLGINAGIDSSFVLNLNGASKFAGDMTLNGNLIATGNLLPSVTNTYSLGASDKRWANIYANNVDTTNITVTNLNTGFSAGSIAFQGSGKLAEDNNNLFWNDSLNRLGIGTNTPSGPLHIIGDSGLSGNLSGASGSAVVGTSTAFLSQVSPGDFIAFKENYDNGDYINVLQKALVTSVTDNNNLSTNYDFYDGPISDRDPNYAVIKSVLLENSDLHFKNTFNAPTAIYFGDETFIHNTGTTTFAPDIDGNIDGQQKNTNTYIGLSAGFLPVDVVNAPEAYYNTALGYLSLANNISGKTNTALGALAMQDNTIGQDNIAIGYGSLAKSTSSNYNVGIGIETLKSNSGDNNVAIGYKAMQSNAGVQNTAIGFDSLLNNGVGSYNLSLGSEAGYSNSTGNYNTFLGYRTGYTNASGVSNVSIGNQAGFSNTDGNYNTAIGNQAGYSIASGQDNVAIGNQAGRTVSGGSGNVFIGAKAGYDETGSSNLYINNFTDTDTPNIPDKRFSLLYGEFYNPGVHDNPLLRINGKVGISPMLEDYTPSSLLHLYQTSEQTFGKNPEIKIQANADGSTFQEHWAVYQDRSSRELRFWNDRGNNDYTVGTDVDISDLDNILSLSVGTTSAPWGGRIGINTSNPQGTLEVHDGMNSVSSLLLSSYNDTALGTTADASGEAVINFKVGRNNPVDGLYQVAPSGSITSGYSAWGDAGQINAFSHAAIVLKTLSGSGSDVSTLVARDSKIGISGDVDANRSLRVHGATRSDDYYSGNDHKGIESQNVCMVDTCNPVAGCEYSNSILMCFEDGLLVKFTNDCGLNCSACNCTL